MSITQERSGTASQNGGGTTIVANFGTAPAEGNLLVAVVGTTNISSLPTNWATAVSLDSRAYLCWRIAGASEPTTATFTLTAATQGVLVWAEYSATNGWETAPVDVTASYASGTGLSCSTGTTASTTQADALAVGGFRLYGGAVSSGRSYTNSYTETDDIIVESPEAWSVEVAFADKVLSSVAATESTLSWTTPSKGYRGVVAVFLPVSAVDQVARPTSTITAGTWDTGPTTGQALHTYAGDASDTTYIEDTTV